MNSVFKMIVLAAIASTTMFSTAFALTKNKAEGKVPDNTFVIEESSSVEYEADFSKDTNLKLALQDDSEEISKEKSFAKVLSKNMSEVSESESDMESMDKSVLVPESEVEYEEYFSENEDFEYAEEFSEEVDFEEEFSYDEVIELIEYECDESETDFYEEIDFFSENDVFIEIESD